MFKNLEAEISRAGMTYKSLAEQLGCNQATFSLKMNGQSKFTLPEAFKIQQILNGRLHMNLKIDYLFKPTDSSNLF